MSTPPTMTSAMHLKRRSKDTTNQFGATCRYTTLFPTIDHSYLTNDGYQEEDSYLDIDYQEADYGNELDLASPNCDKSIQHDDFVEIDDLSLGDLPKDICHPSVIVWLRYSAQLVVRISRKANATGRAFVIKDNINKEYPCKNLRCPYNQLLGDGHFVHGGLGIITNKHVVKNDDEAKQTKVEFFYHSDDRRDMVVREYGQTVHVTNHNLDYTMFTCSMHRSQFVDHVNICTKVASYAWRCIPQKIRRKLKEFAIVISHPHGTSKRVSIGKVVGSELRNDSKYSVSNQKLLRNLYEVCEKNKALRRFAVYFKLMPDITLTVKVTYYDAATCPGSSGAPVYMGNSFIEEGIEVNPPHTHRGRHPVNGYNNCYT